jgi:hypothetical protein
MSQMVATGARDLRIAREVALKATGAAADTSVQILLVTATSGLAGGERERVRIQDLAEAKSLVDSFLDHTKSDPILRKLWVRWEPDFAVTVIVNDNSLDEELRLRALFIDLASRLSDPSRGDLYVLPASDEPEDAELIFSR